jgi:hypothetical protein
VRNSKQVEKALHSYSKDTTITIDIVFDTTLYKQACVEVWQAQGFSPVGYSTVTILKPSSVTIPITFKNVDAKQYLKIRIAQRSLPFDRPLTYGKPCIDSIPIQSGMYYKNFWTKGIVMRCSYNVAGKNIPTDQIKHVLTSADSIRGNKIFYSKSQYLTTISITDNGTTYQFWMGVNSKSNDQTLNVAVYPNAMTKLKEYFGILKLDQIKSLDEQQREAIRKKFPEYADIVDPMVDFKMLGATNMLHIILFTMIDSSGEKYVGINNCK